MQPASPPKLPRLRKVRKLPLRLLTETDSPHAMQKGSELWPKPKL